MQPTIYKVGNKVKFDNGEYEILSFTSDGESVYLRNTIKFLSQKPVLAIVEFLGVIIR